MLGGMTRSFGYFDQHRREYVITDPITPEPWINYLDGNGKMNAFISNGAGGIAWYDQPHTGRLTRYRLNGLPMDSPGFYLYIKDGVDIWNPSFFPTMKKLDSWECRHGMLQVFSNAKTGGETVMLAEQFIYASKLLVEILRHSGKAEEISFFEKKSRDFSEVLASDVCWDGGWFKRLLYPDAELGSRKNKEGKIFLNTQSWAAMAGSLPAAKVRKAMDNVSEMLDTECGIRLFTPPFTTMMDGVTRFHTNTPGAGENGGLFLHANTWAIIAEAMLGNPQRAWKYFSQILPNNLSARNPEHYGREPYALASWVYGPDHDAFGHAALTWLTGGAAWTYIAGTEYILGIRPTLDGLLVSPCIPPDWDKFEVQRRVRGATYRITVLNPDKVGCGNVHLTVDGSPLKGSLVPYAPAGKTVEVRAVISHAKQFANR